MICKNCGSEINENVRFCQVCGCKVENENNYTDKSSSAFSISIVLKTSGTNSYGGVVSGYELYKYKPTTNSCVYRGNDDDDVSGLMIETILLLDDSLNFYSDDAKKEMIDRINKLNESGLLEKVSIIDQAKNLSINKTKEEMSS